VSKELHICVWWNFISVFKRFKTLICCFSLVATHDVSHPFKCKAESLHVNMPWRYRAAVEAYLYSFFVSALERGWWSTLIPGRFTSPPLPIAEEAGWTPETAWMVVGEMQFLSLTGVRSADRPTSRECLYRLQYPSTFFFLIYLGLPSVPFLSPFATKVSDTFLFSSVENI
jgi:hypothetical protein